MSSEPHVTWPTFLEDKYKELCLLIEPSEVEHGPSNLTDFRSKFKEFCRKKVENRTRIQFDFIDTFENISGITVVVTAKSLDNQNSNPDKNLEGLVFTAALSILQIGNERGARVEELVKFLAKLNKIMPAFKTDVERFPEDEKVQKTIQEIYNTFIGSYMQVIGFLSKGDRLGPKFTEADQYRELLKDTETEIEEARARLNNSIKQAALGSEMNQMQNTIDSFAPQDEGGMCKIEYEKGKRRGRGSFGIVYEVVEKSTRTKMILKQFPFGGMVPDDELKLKVMEEVKIMRSLHHDNIVHFTGYAQDAKCLSIFMEPVAQYNLYDYLNRCCTENFDEGLIRSIRPWFGELLDALAYTHKKNIRHRDIKPKNILIFEKTAYLCDFGLAKNFLAQDPSASRGPKPEGTEMYRAPENVSNKERGRAADVFSLGCVFAEMMTVLCHKSVETFEGKRGRRNYRDCLPTVRDWLRDLMKENPSKIKDVCQTIRYMLEGDPDERIKALNALERVKADRSMYGL